MSKVDYSNRHNKQAKGFSDTYIERLAEEIIKENYLE
jgi:hypothetical protein